MQIISPNKLLIDKDLTSVIFIFLLNWYFSSADLPKLAIGWLCFTRVSWDREMLAVYALLLTSISLCMVPTPVTVLFTVGILSLVTETILGIGKLRWEIRVCALYCLLTAGTIKYPGQKEHLHTCAHTYRYRDLHTHSLPHTEIYIDLHTDIYRYT